jgi:DNA-binding IclR family transcriptional regulator
VQSSRIVAACNGKGATCGQLMEELNLPSDSVYKLVRELVANELLREEVRGGKRYLFDNTQQERAMRHV